jgi:hypothetical protein
MYPICSHRLDRPGFEDDRSGYGLAVSFASNLYFPSPESANKSVCLPFCCIRNGGQYLYVLSTAGKVHVATIIYDAGAEVVLL